MNASNAENNDFLVEVMVDGAPAYVHCTRKSDNMAADTVKGLPGASLEQAFGQGALRAIPIAGQKPSMTFGLVGQSMTDGHTTGSG